MISDAKPTQPPLAGTRRLLDVMERLRSPEGCPWDREQTHRSLVPFLLEEVYELIDALESGQESHFKEELGDVLLQVVFHARIAEENGKFDFDALAGLLADKMIQRHPHVFLTQSASDAEAVSNLWHRKKMEQRNSALDGIPPAMPALAWAHKVSSRAARSGFEWRNTDEILGKIAEEAQEVQRAALALKTAGVSHDSAEYAHLEEELGDLLFAQVQLARWLRLDPEAALRKGVRKFSARYRWMEQTLHQRGDKPERQNAETWWSLWNAAKSAVG